MCEDINKSVTKLQNVKDLGFTHETVTKLQKCKTTRDSNPQISHKTPKLQIKRTHIVYQQKYGNRRRKTEPKSQRK